MGRLLCYVIVFFAFAKANAQQPVASGSLEKIVFYYDVSYSMRERNIQAEIDFLNTYFEKYPEATVTLVKMSTALQDESTHVVSKGNWETLKEALSEVGYDGASDFSKVDFTQKVDRFLLSTDGEESISKLPQSGENPITIINTVLEDKGDLKWLAESSGGIYEEFIDKTNKNSLAQSKIKATLKRTTQSSEAISSITDSNTLGAVLIKGQVEDPTSDEYNTIDIGGVKYDKKKIGYSVSKITEKEITPIMTDVKQAVVGQFSNLKIPNTAQKGDLSEFVGRHQRMTITGDTSGLIVIDGIPQAKSDNSIRAPGNGAPAGARVGITSHIDPATIESITYLRGLAATNRYGSLGKGGVVEITTKIFAGTYNKNKKIKKALGTTPTYTGNVLVMSDFPNKEYIKELRAKTDINDPLNTYLSYRNIYGDDPEFFLNVARYFEGWNKPEITARILSNVTEVANNDLATLKALLYLYEVTQNYKQQTALAEHILDLNEKNAQAYLDLARSYRLSGRTQDALEMYHKILSPTGMREVNFTGIKESASKEYKEFIASSGKTISSPKIITDYKAKPEKVARRIVVEYNDPEALFDLKIINPQNRFFTWSHTTTAEAARLEKEKQQGYNQEEFFLMDTDKGEWRFNCINYGIENENGLESTFLKITIFKNWGSPNQSREVKIVQLSEVNKEQEILSLKI